ncbi:MAG: anhydro-N-acetylmuramic acid kinase [Altibacter sp.]|uniref:anhydro-N-acetylmuramic acid kinase n=1 Tax=Altibacter sp. TaxID=2024823 RepID=UPI001DAB2791|nr:anhydro-N-acetylmuramic acid kinase [Altibacter sp.]MBZ0326404.1 anhydro-N-acetylmuramic acid kinase [Altibacter sp.]
MSKNNYHILGVMSGTSLDGIDVAELAFSLSEDQVWDFKILHAETIAYSDSWKSRLKEAISFSEAELQQLNSTYTQFLAEVISAFIKKQGIQGLDAVCSHGHTILHRPDQGITLQIGNLPELATRIRQTVVCDFRVQDVALGGQGAPLVPIGDRLLFGEYDHCLNLGGFANVSSEMNGNRIAHDICPVNIVLNPFAEKLGKPYDEGGELAAQGIVNPALLRQLNSLPYYKIAPPKSLGLEWVKEFIFPLLNDSGLSNMDILSTCTEHIAMQIADRCREGVSVLVTGGGAYNDYLISRIQTIKNMRLIRPTPEIIEFKEALIFGLLGVLKLRNEVNCLSSVTGAQKDHSCGIIYFP